MLKIIAILGITFLSLFAFDFLATSMTHAVTPGVHAAGVEEPLHVKYRQQDISSDGVLLRHPHPEEQALITLNTWPSDTARTLFGEKI